MQDRLRKLPTWRRCQGIDDAMDNIRSLVPIFTQHAAALPQASDTIAKLYTARYRKSKDWHDLCTALHFCEVALTSVPNASPVRGSYLLQYMDRLQDLAKQEESVTLGESRT